MNASRYISILCAFVVVLVLPVYPTKAAPLGTAFTYQGRLIDANNAADGLYDFQFKLFDAVSDGNKLGQDVNKPEVDVIDGYFTVELDFGSVFDGNERWLDIGVRPGIQNDPNVYTALSPRQKVTPTPYAIYTKNAAGDSDWIISGNNMYSGVPGNVGIGTTTPSSPLTIKTVAGSDIELVSTGFNADIMSNATFKVGTSTSQPFSIITNNLYQMTVDSAGKVGIGTTGPAAKLDVVGDINVASDYKIDGNTVLSVPGTYNTFIGVGAGAVNTGTSNTFLGYEAGLINTSGLGNTFLGSYTGYFNTTGQANVFLGVAAGYQNTTGNNNMYLGNFAGHLNTTGSKNTFIGYYAGHDNISGIGNVFLGYQAGYTANDSNKLYIANSSGMPLIYGDFSAKNVGINTITPVRNLHINDVMRLQPRATEPDSPAEGDIYYSSTSHTLMVYNGTTWKACF